MCFCVCVFDMCVMCVTVSMHKASAGMCRSNGNLSCLSSLCTLRYDALLCHCLFAIAFYLNLQSQEVLGSEMLATTMGFFDVVSGVQTPDLMLIQQALCSLGHFLNLFVHHGFSYFPPSLLQCVSCLIFNLWSTGCVNILVFLSLTWQSKTHYSGIFRHGQELKWEGKMQRENRKGEERRHFLWDVSGRPAFRPQAGQPGTLTLPDAAIWTWCMV